MPVPDPTPEEPDPRLVELVEECERLAELRTDVAVADRPADILDGVDAEWDAARLALHRYVLAEKAKAVKEAVAESLRDAFLDGFGHGQDSAFTYERGGGNFDHHHHWRQSDTQEKFAALKGSPDAR